MYTKQNFNNDWHRWLSNFFFFFFLYNFDFNIQQTKASCTYIYNYHLINNEQ